MNSARDDATMSHIASYSILFALPKIPTRQITSVTIVSVSDEEPKTRWIDMPNIEGVNNSAETCAQSLLCGLFTVTVVPQRIPNYHLHLCQWWWICNNSPAVYSAWVWSGNPLSFSTVQKRNEKPVLLLSNHAVHSRGKQEWHLTLPFWLICISAALRSFK